MNTLILSGETASAIAHALLHFLWQGAAIAILLAALLYIVRPSSARVRYALACAAMLAMIGAFVGTLVWFWPPQRATVAVRATGPRVLPLPLLSSFRPPVEGSSPSRQGDPIAPAWVARAWMLGVALLSLRSLVAWLAAMRLRRTGVAAASADWQARLSRLAERVRVSGPVMLLESRLTDIPVVIGSFKPVILVPASLFTGFPAEHLEMILLHELAHIRRHDYLVNLLQSLAEDVLFYHPAVWWVSTVIRAEREHCCDDVVVAALGDARGFAEALAALEERRWSAYDAAVAANGGSLMHRIQRLLNVGPRRPRIAAPLGFSAGLLVAGLALASMTHAQPSRVAQTPVAQTPGAQTVAPQTPAPQAPAVGPAPAPETAPAPAPDSASAALETPYRKWLNEDVYWIITSSEREAFGRLATDDELEQFIEQFWLRRDPTPDTAENEYREEYYRRIAYANEVFGASDGVPGWKTDRGMIYIRYGPADEREEHRAGGSYERPIQEGGGTTSTYPFEKWRYRYLEGIGNDVTIEFVDTSGKGEYRMTVDPAAKVLYIPAAGLGTGAMPLPDSANQFSRLQTFAELQAPPKSVIAPEDAIEAVFFTGTLRDSLSAIVSVHKGGKFDKENVDRSVRQLQSVRWFDNVTARDERGKVGWVVTFMVVERPVAVH